MSEKRGFEVKPASNNSMLKLLKSILFTCTFAVWGMAVSVQYTTYADLQIRLNSSPYGITYALSIGCMGKICGGLFSIISDRFAKASDLILAIMITLAGTTFLLVPFCLTLNQLGICFMFTNLGFYFMQSAVHSQITSLWSTGGKPARYVVHLGFSIGLILGALLSTPFTSGVRGFDKNELSNRELQLNFSENAAYAPDSISGSENLTTTPKYFEIIISPSTDLSTIEYPYVFVFALSLVLAALFVFSYCMGLMTGTLYKLRKPFDNQSWLNALSPRTWAGGDAKVGIVMAAMLVTWTVLQNLMNFGTDSYLQKYALESQMGFDAQSLSCFGLLVIGGGAMGRLVGMIASRFVSIRYILIVVAFGQALFAILCLSVGSGHMTSLTVLVTCLYFFRDAAMPTIYAWTGHYIQIYGILIGISELVSSLVIVLYKPLQDYYYNSVAIESIFVTTTLFGCILFVGVWFMHYFAISQDSYNRKSKKFYQSNKQELPVLYVPCRDISYKQSEL